jgi:DNA-binding transcriptional MerR regulator
MSKPAGADREATASLPSIPAKRYFTIGEVSELCAVKPHVLRYWEQEFTQLKPIKRSGNRRYYQHHEVLLIRRIRELLYEQGFTINGARNRLDGAAIGNAARRRSGRGTAPAPGDLADADGNAAAMDDSFRHLLGELQAIRALLAPVPEPATAVPQTTDD